MLDKSRTLFVCVGRKRLPFAGLAHASRAYRETIDRLGLGASKTPLCTITDDSGAIVAHVSYNGKIWAGRAQDWQSDAVPLYNPYAPA